MKNRKAQGFTLIELLIVIAIIGILAAVLIPNLLAARQKANLTAGLAFTRNVVTAMEVLRDSGGKFADVTKTDCGTGTAPFPAKPSAVSSCAIIYSTAANDYIINTTLDAKATGVAFYTYSSLTQLSAPAAAAATAPTGF